MSLTVLVTDIGWPNTTIEEAILAPLGARVLLAKRGDEAELLALAPEADAILTCWKQIAPAVLDAAPRCRIVSRYGVGLDNIPVVHATALGMVVTNVPDFCHEEVSDHALALILACARQIVTFARRTQRGEWNRQTTVPLPRLRGQTLGIVGYGNIARTLIPKAQGLGLRILVYRRSKTMEDALPGVTFVADLAALLQASDYVSIHVPLTEETHGLLNADTLRQMKPSAFLVNTSRGAVVNESDLEAALRHGWIAGAALDVLSQEPPPPDHPLLQFENVIITPHAAFYSDAAIAELQQKAALHVAQMLRGETPTNIVNPQVLSQANYRGK
ncbi:MAG: C-terminal binding protein [Caldilineaceae bacterium]